MAETTAFTSSIYPLHLAALTVPGYAALYSMILNLAVAFVVSMLVHAFHLSQRADRRQPEDYTAPAHG